ncbi:hypothetical protein QNH46_17775 [Paenibacillus woosongensis]|uniref:Uncharacterized protein n=1 Tax=Paenibacillus woosongensis TaxID=307580 RepID=A0AA95L156_9BACL|nr:hypothetical protein [Paenibacillus woosongensis]WHX47966.1 hypothetical protein QNH46_17775 [Paenibacillus woosongensis]
MWLTKGASPQSCLQLPGSGAAGGAIAIFQAEHTMLSWNMGFKQMAIRTGNQAKRLRKSIKRMLRLDDKPEITKQGS